MTYDFDKPVERRHTWSEKWDYPYPGWPDALPMWVADMDFEAPPEVTAALAERVAHGVYGYTLLPEEACEAAIGWRLRRLGQGLRREWIVFSSGVVCSLKAALDAFTSPGDGIVVQPPVYPPFMDIARRDGRKLLRNPLLQGADGRWRMDLAGLEDCFRAGARLLFLCNPHNPVGRVWTADELSAVASLCARYDVLVMADEIHCDILRPDAAHTPMAMLPGMQERVITLFSSTKTFNLAGLQNSVAVVADPGRKRQLMRALFRCNHNTPNLFGMIAQQAAWTHGEAWLEEANRYIAANCDLALDMLAAQDAMIPTKPEGTYLLWLDCRALAGADEELRRFFTDRCGVWPTMGRAFEGEGFVRLNLATRRAIVEEGIGRILNGLKRR
jgi:cystathionine beta-lyase